MKKFPLILLSVSTTLLLCNCQRTNNTPAFVGGDLIFTELYIGESYSNRAVELANVADSDLDLNEYVLNIYRNGGNGNVKPSETIALKGTLKSQETYVIAYNYANSEIQAKADLVSEDFLNDGTFPMTINNNHGEVVDYLGYPGYFYDVANHSDTVRKVEKLKASTFTPYDWIRYPTNNLNNLGNLYCLDNDALYAGPKLTDADFFAPYATNNNLGGGGCVEVSLSYTIDGDTTKFNFGYSLSEYGISGSNSLRYYGINTPEISHGGNPADPYGPEAKEFTNSIINKAKHYVVQSVKGYSLTETYDRLLGYVWVSMENNPKPEDYFLLNHYIVQNGYARIGHITRGSYNDDMTYKGVSYVEYLYDAQQYAIYNKLHIYEGE